MIMEAGIMKSKKVGKAFLNHIACIEKLIFTDGGFFDGYRTTTVQFEGDQVVYEVKHSLSPAPSFPEIDLDKSEFIAKLQSLHLEDWDREYVNSGILDGEQWKLTIRFSDKKRPLKIYGDNAYPPNFKEFQKLMKSEDVLPE